MAAQTAVWTASSSADLKVAMMVGMMVRWKAGKMGCLQDTCSAALRVHESAERMAFEKVGRWVDPLAFETADQLGLVSVAGSVETTATSSAE